MTNEIDTTPAWERRFRAPVAAMPDWSPQAPDRIAYPSTESGVWQVHAWDRATNARRQVTDHPVGVTSGTTTLDGEHVVYWIDENGDESGRWWMQPFVGGDATPFLDGVPHGWNEGLSLAPGIAAAGISDKDGFAIWVAADGGPARELYRHRESVRIGDRVGINRSGLSADGTLLCLEHSEHGDLLHQALRVVDARTGAMVGEQLDPGMSLSASCWSPIPGDQRLVITHEREGEERPAIWNLTTGERIDVTIDLPGIVEAQDWWPDASALLLVNLVEGRHRLFRYDVATGAVHRIDAPVATIFSARVRPDGSVWFRESAGNRHPVVMDQSGEAVLQISGEVPPGRPYTSWLFENEHGDQVHGFYVTPKGEPPFPTMMFVHGGPTWLDTDRWQPEVQAYVDAGFAVGMVNYRGSIGYGREWRDVLIGDIGGPELEDVNAGLADLVGKGIADPGRAVVAGWSWGGYTTLMELGKHPELWMCGVAGVPVGDYLMEYEEESPLLQAYDRSLLGGEPKDLPELMADRNPINHADDVKAPVLFVIGENDSRCPYRQAMAYVERLAARGAPHEVYVFGTGHGSNDMDEEVRQVRTILDFLARNVPGVTAEP